MPEVPFSVLLPSLSLLQLGQTDKLGGKDTVTITAVGTSSKVNSFNTSSFKGFLAWHSYYYR